MLMITRAPLVQLFVEVMLRGLDSGGLFDRLPNSISIQALSSILTLIEDSMKTRKIT